MTTLSAEERKAIRHDIAVDNSTRRQELRSVTLIKLLDALESAEAHYDAANQNWRFTLDELSTARDEVVRLRVELEGAKEHLEVAIGERDYEASVVNRTWKALGIETLEQANGKTVYELVAALRAEAERLRKALEYVADPHAWGVHGSRPILWVGPGKHPALVAEDALGYPVTSSATCNASRTSETQKHLHVCQERMGHTDKHVCWCGIAWVPGEEALP